MFSRFAIFAGLLVATLLGAAASPAHADWHEASSDHFVIYADDSEKDIRRFAENLEKFHSAMAYILARDFEKPSPSNRVVIFVVGNQRDIRKIAGTNSRTLAGFYVPRAGGSRAFVQDIRNKNGYPDFSTIVLLHEYAHHFMISSSRFARPRWMSEGAAEFFASAGFNRDGSVLIGRPAVHRGRELAYADDVSVRELLDPELYEANKGRRYDAFYGRSWLMYHYLTFSEQRQGQMNQYWLGVLNGKDGIAAGEEAFGDLDQLQKELDAYKKQKRMFTFNLEPSRLTVSPVSLRKLSKGEAEMMPLRIRSQRGVTEAQAAELVIEVREVAKKHPEDAAVFAALAEAEYDAGNDEKAIAAADKAIALNPNLTNPYVQKGYALFRQARDAEDKDAAYDLAMKPFSQLNALENDHPLPLIYYYRSYAHRGVEPTDNAKAALTRAAELAPFDKTLWFNLATMHMQDGEIALARRALQPLANDPHGGRRAATAKLLVTALSTVPEGTEVRRSDIARAIRGPVNDASTSDNGGGDADAEDGEDQAETRDEERNSDES